MYKCSENTNNLMYIIKISLIKTIKFSVKIIIKITDRNTGMQKVSNSLIKSIRKMSTKMCKIF